MFKKLFVFFILSFLGLTAGLIFFIQQPIVLPDGKETLEIEIKRGQTLSQLAYAWEREGWLPSAKILLLEAKVLNTAKNIKPGEYEILSHTRGYQLLEQLTLGSNKRYRVTFIEGTRLVDALNRLKEAPKLNQDIKPLTTQSVQELFDLNTHAEGWVYPDTYVYQSGDNVSSILLQAHSRMKSVLDDEWSKYQRKLAAGELEKLPYNNSYEALIMASIVEKETGKVSERPEIAGVFVRRLQKNMRLETDPTVIYGLGEDYAGNLRKKHLRDSANPYNTYRTKGLPPTPIALAGRAAISASLNPKEGNSLFFVAKGDGSHYFSSSLAEHNKAVRKYQIYRRSKDYRSAPVAQ